MWLLALLIGAPGCGDDVGDPADAGPRDSARRTVDARECPAPLGPPRPRTTTTTAHPMDGVLRLNELQAEGTHNSYHIEPPIAEPEWMYTHQPLDVQLESLGVREVELDLNWDPRCERYEVYHLRIDPLSTCGSFRECLEIIRVWSDARPSHHPIFVHVEVKDLFAPDVIAARFDRIDQEIRSVFPEELIVSPDMVRGAHASLAEAITADGWPTLGATRGKVLFYLDPEDAHHAVYLDGRPNLEGRVMFIDAPAGDPNSVLDVRHDPVASRATIEAEVRAGYLVRTSVASAVELEAALASGAQMISSDYPGPVEGQSWYVEIPAGTPSRCNPLIAPSGCVSTAIEDPSLL